MAVKVLVLHGPNVEWTLERDGKPPLTTLGGLDAELVARAARVEAEVRCASASGEGELVDVLYASRAWCDAVVVNPSSLAPVAFALADALTLLAKPAVEVQLRHETAGRGRSALKGTVDKQYQGQGPEGYFRALEAVVKSARERGRPRAAAPGATAQSASSERSASKSIGRRPAAAAPDSSKSAGVARAATAAPAPSPSPGPAPAPAPAPARSLPPVATTSATPQAGAREAPLTRSLVREHLAARLGGRLSVDAFVEWARAAYAQARGGTPIESGQRELLEDVLMLLAASRGSSDEALLALMTRLDP